MPVLRFLSTVLGFVILGIEEGDPRFEVAGAFEGNC